MSLSLRKRGWKKTLALRRSQEMDYFMAVFVPSSIFLLMR
ncbi:oxetanocin A biosynthetic enzyme [Salmonella enterica subsp. arizonae]|uniref:Oxetanocin A biosynthetic enzyme n=1 Tax=Salmonella enterica subsp. arizonae TaxID=59203 RepID=A0A2X4T8B5_SALER|nr:oxetanocin A biosynthetic enzyme [Salmonella enterica subsp. arizonae]